MIPRCTFLLLSLLILIILIPNNYAATKIHVLVYETSSEDDELDVDDGITATQRQRTKKQRQLRQKSVGSGSKTNHRHSPAHKLVSAMNDLQQYDLLEATLFGQGQQFVGYGSKLLNVLPILQHMIVQDNYHNDTLIVISDGRDVLFNSHAVYAEHNAIDRRLYVQQLVHEFRESYDAILLSQGRHNGTDAIVVSAEAQCCVSALTHVSPHAAYFDNRDRRVNRACNSGEKECLWLGDDYAQPWDHMMTALQKDRQSNNNNNNDMILHDDRYLNAGLMVGTVSNLLHVMKQLQIQEQEDDQAVLTDYMSRHRHTILLDYSQSLFGNTRRGQQKQQKQKQQQPDGCVFGKDDHHDNHDDKRLIHTVTGTKPFLLHTPGQYYTCYDRMADDLGYHMNEQTHEIRQRLLDKQFDSRFCNYGLQNHSLGDGIPNNPLIICNYSGYTHPPTMAPVPTSPTSSSLINILHGTPSSGTAPAAPAPTPIASPSGNTIPTSSFIDILNQRTKPTSAPVAPPTDNFLSLLAQRTKSSSAPIPAPSTTTTQETAPASNFIDLLAQRTKPSSAPIPAPTTAQETVPVSFLELLGGAPAQSSNAVTVATPTAPPIALTAPTSSSGNLLDALAARTKPTAAPVTSDNHNFINILSQRTEAPVPVPTTVSAPVTSDFINILSQRTTAPVPVPTPAVVTIQETVPVSFMDLLGSPTAPTTPTTTNTAPVPTAPVTVPTTTTAEASVPVSFMTLVSSPTTPTAESPISAPTGSNFLDELAGRTQTTSAPVPTSSTTNLLTELAGRTTAPVPSPSTSNSDTVPVSFINLLSERTTPTAAPIPVPTTTNEAVPVSFMDLLSQPTGGQP